MKVCPLYLAQSLSTVPCRGFALNPATAGFVRSHGYLYYPVLTCFEGRIISTDHSTLSRFFHDLVTLLCHPCQKVLLLCLSFRSCRKVRRLEVGLSDIARTKAGHVTKENQIYSSRHRTSMECIYGTMSSHCRGSNLMQRLTTCSLFYIPRRDMYIYMYTLI